jgi:hypothetical protein
MTPTAPPSRCDSQCPLPNAQLKSRGSLGMKRHYSATGADLLAALNRRVYLTQAGVAAVDAASDGSGQQQAGDLILYDPDTDEAYQSKLAALRCAAAAVDAASAHLAAAEGAVAAKYATTGVCDEAGDGPEGASTTAAQQGSQSSADGDDKQAQPTPAAAVQALQAAVAEARAALEAARTAEAGASKSAGPARVKVHAEAFLVEKLRAHQREGVRFIFSCLCGVRQDGVSGAVLADGMGLGKTFQTVGRAGGGVGCAWSCL